MVTSAMTSGTLDPYLCAPPILAATVLAGRLGGGESSKPSLQSLSHKLPDTRIRGRGSERSWWQAEWPESSPWW